MGTKTLALLELEDKMIHLQELMIDTGILKGLTHPDTIKCSQELDGVMNDFHTIKLKQEECDYR